MDSKNRQMDASKTLWHMDRVIDHFDKGKRVAPVHIDMGLTKFCNVKCVFCYGKFQNMCKDLISREALLQIVKDAADIGVKSLAFIGDGEPTCNPACYEALDLGGELGLDLAISTNGALINTDEKRESILKNCKWMRFCLSAGTKEGYKKIHGVDCYETVIKNIKAMVEMKIEKGYDCEIGLQAVFVPTLMAEEMVEEAKLAVELGVDYFVIKQCSLPDEGQTGMMQFKMSDYDKPEVRDALKRAEDMTTNKTQIVVKWNTIDLKGKKSYKHCPSIPLIWEMSGNGDCYPCGYMFGGKKKFDKYKFGNVHEISLKDMFESDRYWKIIEEMRCKFDVQKQCKGCCRQEHVNIFLDNYLNRPRGVNFI